MSLEQKLENKVEGVLQSKHASRLKSFLGSGSGSVLISCISFIESALPVPIVTDPFLVMVILANRQKTKWLIFWATAFSVIGGLFAYFTALYFFDLLLKHLSAGAVTELNTALTNAGSDTFMLTLVGSVTPVPYTIIAWVVGALKGSWPAFVLASVVGRGGRYLLIGYATYHFGQRALAYVRRYLLPVTTTVLLLTGLYLGYRLWVV